MHVHICINMHKYMKKKSTNDFDVPVIEKNHRWVSLRVRERARDTLGVRMSHREEPPPAFPAFGLMTLVRCKVGSSRWWWSGSSGLSACFVEEEEEEEVVWPTE